MVEVVEVVIVEEVEVESWMFDQLVTSSETE